MSEQSKFDDHTRLADDDATLLNDATIPAKPVVTAPLPRTTTQNTASSLPVDTTQQQQLAPGMVLKERFVLQDVLGTGGMSVVYLARDLRKEEAGDTASAVAIKVLGSEFKYHPDSFKVLQRESKKAQALAHPNIVSVYDFDRDGHVIYMTMEVLDGQPLDKLIKAHKNVGLPLEQVLPIIDGVAQALSYAHKKDIIHSDLKPANIFLTKDNVVKVLDFGIARAKHGSRAAQDSFDVGELGALTPAYATCEMFSGTDPDPRDDIYALACITYELLTGTHPYGRKSAVKALEHRLTPTPVPGLKKRQWAALKQALALEREHRTADVLTFADAFKPRVLRWKIIIGVAVVLALSMAGLSYYAHQTQELSQILSDDAARRAPVVLTKEKQAEIADWLALGKTYQQMGMLAVPPGDSAFDAYQKVLDIDPYNKAALAAQREIADFYRQQTRSALERKDYVEAETMVALGLRVRPADAELLQLQQKVKQAR